MWTCASQKVVNGRSGGHLFSSNMSSQEPGPLRTVWRRILGIITLRVRNSWWKVCWITDAHGRALLWLPSNQADPWVSLLAKARRAWNSLQSLPVSFSPPIRYTSTYMSVFLQFLCWTVMGFSVCSGIWISHKSELVPSSASGWVPSPHVHCLSGQEPGDHMNNSNFSVWL